jgi:5-methylcytosine-specific restriction endonuclease McrA
MASSWSEAKLTGAAKYFTGRPCKLGHVAERYASTGQCVNCISSYSAKWDAANPEKRRKITKNWHRKNRSSVNATMRKWYDADPNRIAARRARARRYQAANPEVLAACGRRRRARKAAAPGSHSAQDVLHILKMQRWTCAYCPKDLRKNKPHIDHIIPLARGGSNRRSNLQALCQSCNNRKWAKDPIDFAREIGLLI